MNEQTIRALQDALTPLAQKLGATAAQLYAIYTRQMVAEGVVNLITSIFFLVLSITAPLIYWRIWSGRQAAWQAEEQARREKSYFIIGDDHFGWTIAGVLLICLSILGLCLSIAFINDSVLHLINPQYYAIDRLVTTVRGGGQ